MHIQTHTYGYALTLIDLCIHTKTHTCIQTHTYAHIHTYTKRPLTTCPERMTLRCCHDGSEFNFWLTKYFNCSCSLLMKSVPGVSQSEAPMRGPFPSAGRYERGPGPPWLSGISCLAAGSSWPLVRCHCIHGKEEHFLRPNHAKQALEREEEMWMVFHLIACHHPPCIPLL